MEQDFYKKRLQDKGIDVLVPDEKGREIVNNVIYDELTKGQVKESSRVAYRDVINELIKRGAQGIVMGCTEITMLIDHGDLSVPLFDTTKIHVEKALEFMFLDEIKAGVAQA